ncbi:MAG: AMP-dependent synthetase and ligase [Puniceicoccaceae bacterium 5H]|nr:MAG: AMP-dependent synthetase and ligase [Puniceicoccaceae bacterium 5H]
MTPDASANVARFLPRMAAQVPDHCAVKVPQGQDGHGEGPIRYLERSFAELERESNAVCRLLAQRGIRRGTRTLLMVKPGLDLIQLTFALFKVGAVPVVIDPGLGLKHFLRCVRHTQPEALVGIPLAQAVRHVFRGSFGSVRQGLTVGRGFQKQVARQAEADADFAPVEAEPDELAAILFTSGSTGPAKGVCYTHRMFDAQVRLIRAQYAIEPGEVDLPMLPVFALFNPALGMTTVVPIMNPSRPATVEPAAIVQAIRQDSVTNSFGSPALWTRVAKHLEQTGEILPTVKRVLMAGAPVPPSLMERLKQYLPNCEIHTPYGATECLPVSSISAREVLAETAEQTAEGQGTCVGRPLPEVDVRVIALTDASIPDWSAVEVLPVGEIGEIVVTGPNVTELYDQLPEKTAAAKIRDGERVWHRMGDLGYLDAEGRIWFCGRKAERIETAQGTLFTDQVEAIYNQHPAVARSALIGLGERPQQTPAIVIEPEDYLGTLEKQALEKELLTFGSQYAVTQPVQRVFFHASFPVDVRHNAKIHRLTLQRHFSSRQK